ncbi:MAG: CNNM domain-containing protein, partial [Peptococcus niger]
MNLNAYILAIIVLLGLSAFFSASETAFTSLNTIRVKKMAADGNRKAKRVLDMADQYERLLSSILVGNNIVNITCASLGTVLFVELMGARGITVSTLVITIGTLIFGEISPKTIAKERAESVALAFSGPLYGIMLILRPVTAVFALLQNALGMLFGNQEDGGITEDELMTIVDEAEEFGNIEADERELIRSAMQFDDRIVGDIYT